MAEKECPRHGRHTARRCPACAWAEKYPRHVRHQSGCPRCGRPLDSNGLLMWCGNEECPMCSTAHGP